jgi:hypothetical protein
VVSAYLGGRQTDNLRSERDSAGAAAQTNAESTDKVGNGILADVCKAVSDKQLRAIKRERECSLAEKGQIDKVVPIVTPQVTVQRVSQQDIEKVVDAYLADYLTDLPAKYRDALRTEVVVYLTENPPKPGKDGKPGPAPTPAAIGAAVATYLTQNPPVPGKDGANGVSVASAALDGCDVVFTLSNDTSVRVGPICGPKGEKGDGATAEELRAAFDAYCSDQPGGTCKGTAASPGYPTGWRQTDGSVCTDPDGDHFYTCEQPPPPTPEPPNTPDPTPESPSPNSGR